MNGLRALLYVADFVGLAATAAVVTGRVAEPGVALPLLAAVAAGTLAGSPGLVRRRAWPLALFLLPLGAYLLARALVPVPDGTSGAGAHLAFYAGQVQAGAVAYARDVFPLDVAGNAEPAAAAVAGGLRDGGRGRVSRRSACAGPCLRSSSFSPSPASASPPTRRRATPGPRSPSSCWPAACSPSPARSSASACAPPTRSPAG